eukprot:TRINITY_DN54903_c0_g1_i1.p1 TRINITY_DN54903_c0_g1~~TRINITY_DN54903_c0_g1_i1.p1  ORF type:complete len:415 (-),score=90.56 TRINITY_DN54903_c0_g1_i1:26-1270(-)
MEQELARAQRPESQEQDVEARLSAMASVHEGEVARWIPLGPGGVLAKWHAERMALVQSYALFFNIGDACEVCHMFSLSSIVSILTMQDGIEQESFRSSDEAGAPCLRLRLVVGGRREAVQLRLADAQEAMAWRQRIEMVRSWDRPVQLIKPEPFLPLDAVLRAVEVWRTNAAEAQAEARARLLQQLDLEHGAPARAVAVKCWLSRKVSANLHSFLRGVCSQSDSQGTAALAASLASLHLKRALQRLQQQWVQRAFRSLAALHRPGRPSRDEGCSHAALQGLERLSMHFERRSRCQILRATFFAWHQFSEQGQGQRRGITPSKGNACQKLVPCRAEASLTCRAWSAWHRSVASRALKKAQDVTEDLLDQNVQLLEEFNALPVEMALLRLTFAVQNAQWRLKARAFLRLAHVNRRT